MGVGPLLNYGLSTLSPLIIADLGINDAQFGLLATATFASAAVSSLWLGRLSDRISNPAQLVLIFAGSAAAMTIAALSTNYTVLLLAVLLAGPSQAISNPTTNHIIIHHAAPQQRPGWIGIKQSGVQGCQLFAGLVFPAVATWVGWHGALAFAAVIAVGLLLDGLRHLPAEPATMVQPAISAPRPANGEPPPAGFPVAVWVFAAYALLTGMGMQATNVYLPLFAVRELHFTLVLAGFASGFSGLVGVISRVLWGRRMALGTRASTLLILLGCGALLSAAALLRAGQSGNAVLLWCGVGLYGVSALGSNVVIMSGIMKVVPPATGRCGDRRRRDGDVRRLRHRAAADGPDPRTHRPLPPGLADGRQRLPALRGPRAVPAPAPQPARLTGAKLGLRADAMQTLAG